MSLMTDVILRCTQAGRGSCSLRTKASTGLLTHAFMEAIHPGVKIETKDG